MGGDSYYCPPLSLTIVMRTLFPAEKTMIRIENLTPQLTAEECMEQRRCIEEGLFEIFYQNTRNNRKMIAI